MNSLAIKNTVYIVNFLKRQHSIYILLKWVFTFNFSESKLTIQPVHEFHISFWYRLVHGPDRSQTLWRDICDFGVPVFQNRKAILRNTTRIKTLIKKVNSAFKLWNNFKSQWKNTINCKWHACPNNGMNEDGMMMYCLIQTYLAVLIIVIRYTCWRVSSTEKFLLTWGKDRIQ